MYFALLLVVNYQVRLKGHSVHKVLKKMKLYIY